MKESITTSTMTPSLPSNIFNVSPSLDECILLSNQSEQLAISSCQRKPLLKITPLQGLPMATGKAWREQKKFSNIFLVSIASSASLASISIIVATLNGLFVDRKLTCWLPSYAEAVKQSIETPSLSTSRAAGLASLLGLPGSYSCISGLNLLLADRVSVGYVNFNSFTKLYSRFQYLYNSVATKYFS